tara:strand:- start:1757 stop:2791 length:1035 start_codon:yes stop_codon:yes gene_type:complete
MNFLEYKDKGRTGLANCGNTCYINSCIQCLSHTFELNHFLKQKTYEGKLNKIPDSLLLVEWDNLRDLMWSQNCQIAPWGFVKAIQKVSSLKSNQLFQDYNQNDVQEFLLFLIECFHNSISREVEMKVSGNVENSRDIMAKECFKMMREMYENDYSEIIKMFYGIHVSVITDIKSDETLSVRPEPFGILSVEFPTMGSSSISIYTCLDNYCIKEKLEGEEAWFNEKTNQKQDVNKGIKFWSFPDILIIHLKRWNYSGHKDRRLVDVPLENVSLNKYVEGYNPDSYIYDLYGVCNHQGMTGGGHYTANVKNASDIWYNCNDLIIKEIKKENVVTNEAYCLFFRKKK